ncbi:MAG: hypothetical protein WCA13_12475 [Terriglobales bacterium]
MFNKRAASMLLWMVLALVAISAVPASAHVLKSATATANCQGFTLTLAAADLTPGATYVIDYTFTITCNNGSPTTVPGTVTFTATGKTATVTASGTFSGLSGNCVVTGTAALEVGKDKEIPIIINGGSSATLSCGTPYVCTIPPSGTEIPGGPVSWNKFNTVGSNDVVWINAHIGTPSGVPTNAVTTVQFTEVTFVLNGQTYPLPDGFLTFDPSAPATPTTTYDSSYAPNGAWTTTFNPNNLSDEMFFDGQGVPVDSNISGGGSATLSYTTESTDNDLAFSWQWSAAAYTYWPGNNAAEIQPYHGGPQGFHAGTPLNTQVQKSLIQGPRGGGGSNYTGSWSGTGKGACPGAN